MKRDPVLIGTVSVLIIAFTLSLLNIYIFPNIFFQIDIYRNTEIEEQLDLLQSAENIGLNSSLFEGFNKTEIAVEYPQLIILNITYMINQVESRRSAAYDFNSQFVPKRLNLNYNGTIHGTVNDSTSYDSWIKTIFDNGDGGEFFAFLNNESDYEFYSRHSEYNLGSYSIEDVSRNLTELFSSPARKPDFVIYQKVSYFESRGFLNEYSTEFERIVFLDAFGNVIFFLSNEGSWNTPLF